MSEQQQTNTSKDDNKHDIQQEEQHLDIDGQHENQSYQQEHEGTNGEQHFRQRKAREDEDEEDKPLIPEDLDDFDDDEPPPNLWGRTFFIGFLFSILTFAICGVALAQSIWLSLILLVLLCFVCETTSAIICKGAYKGKRQKRKEWRSTLSRVVLLGVFWAGATGITAGYFVRSLYYVQQLQSFPSINPTINPVSNFGSTKKFEPAGRPQPTIAGRVLGYGFFPVCVAPINPNPTDKNVNYWAIGHGECCTKQPPNCENWDRDKLGGIVLKQNEFYPDIHKAIDNSKTTFSTISHPDAIYLIYGDADAMTKQLETLACTVTLVGFAFALLLQWRKAYFGEY